MDAELQMRIDSFDLYQRNMKIDIKRHLRGQQKLMPWLDKRCIVDDRTLDNLSRKATTHGSKTTIQAGKRPAFSLRSYIATAFALHCVPSEDWWNRRESNPFSR
jgi:hypothetical protein